MKAHPVANEFPMLSEDELQSLADSIRVNGLLHPIIAFGDQIVDGRNRWTAYAGVVKGKMPKLKI